MNNYREIHEALEVISRHCDCAGAKDSQGFNKIDTNFGKDLARRDRLTYNQAKAAYRMLKKYKNQLSGYGIDYDSIPIPVPVSAVETPKQKTTSEKFAVRSGDKIEVRFTGEDFHKTLSQIKIMPGREYNKETKSWFVPLKEISVNKLLNLGFNISNELKEMFSEKEKNLELDLPAEIYPFQAEGVKFIMSKGGGLIGDEMGLGKTIQALSCLRQPNMLPALIVCPASLKINWFREVKRWVPGAKPFIMYGGSTHDMYRNHNIIIINYDIVKKHWAELKLMNFQVLITDECHYLKNSAAQRTKYTKQLAKVIPFKIALSGTPIINKPIELFSTLNMLEPDVWKSQWTYAQRYCGAHHNGFGWVFSGASHTDELHQILSETIMIRRTKCEVLKELPQKQRSVIPVELTNKVKYKEAEANLIKWLYDNEGEEAAIKASNAETLVQFEKLKQMAVEGKMEAIFDWVNNALEEKDKLVIMATHHWVIDQIKEKYGDIAVKLDGRDSQQSRQKSIDGFQNNKNIKIFIGNIKAAGAGITLTAADTTLFVELGWTPGEHDQAEDRIHRIGQESDSVNIYYLIADNTIEDDIIKILDSKRKIVNKVLDGIEAEAESLLKELKQKYVA